MVFLSFAKDSVVSKSHSLCRSRNSRLGRSDFSKDMQLMPGGGVGPKALGLSQQMLLGCISKLRTQRILDLELEGRTCKDPFCPVLCLRAGEGFPA